RKAVACIVKVNNSRFVKRRRSVFLFELFSVARIGYRICRTRESKGCLVSGHIPERAKIRPVRGKLRFRILAILLLLPALSDLAGAQRLPTSVIPSHYKLWIDPNIEKQQFSGEETIDVQ